MNVNPVINMSEGSQPLLQHIYLEIRMKTLFKALMAIGLTLFFIGAWIETVFITVVGLLVFYFAGLNCFSNRE